VRPTKRTCSEHELRKLIDELLGYETRFGSEKLLRLVQVLRELVRWFHEQGHGKVIIPGKDHTAGAKLTEESIITLDHRGD
jgi:hypothetical protein